MGNCWKQTAKDWLWKQVGNVCGKSSEYAKQMDSVDFYNFHKNGVANSCALFCDCSVLNSCTDPSFDEDPDGAKWTALSAMYEPQTPGTNEGAGCVQKVGYFKNAGAWFDDPKDFCELDEIFFASSDYKTPSNPYGVYHTGMIVDWGYIEELGKDGFTTIEGNTDGGHVAYKYYAYDDPRILGAGRPNWDGWKPYEFDSSITKPNNSSYNCVDVSEWNRDIDWEKAKASGVEFAFIRCGFGRYYLLETDPVKRAEKQAKWEETQGEDKYFKINYENALKAGIKIGVFFYSYATDWDSSVDEANICMRIIEDYKDKISFPIFYDIEEQANIPRISDVVMAFVNTLNYYNYNVGVYTGGSWYSSYFKNIDVDYIWLAYWGADDGVPHTKPEYCDIWQYSNKGSVDGIGNRCVDVDILYNTEMKLLINEPDPQPEPSPAPAPAPVPVEPVIIQLDVLSRGSTGGQVNTVKALLNEFGYAITYNGEPLPLDGDFDYDTEQSVNNYKKAYGLNENGIVDAEMWNLILK